MKILELRMLPENERPVKAFADIELEDGTVIREFRVIQEPKRLPMVGNPQISWKDPQDGRIKYKVAHIATAHRIKLIPLAFGRVEKGLRRDTHVGGGRRAGGVGLGQQVAPEVVRCMRAGKQAADADDGDGVHANQPVTV